MWTGGIPGEEAVTAYSWKKPSSGCVMCHYILCYLLFFSRYASLYFCCAVENQDNELLTLETVHRYVELLDKYFGNVSGVLVCRMSQSPPQLRLQFCLFSHSFSLSSLKYELHLRRESECNAFPLSCNS